jgi:predicted kinase
LGPLREGEAYTPEVTAELYADLLPTATEKVLQAGLTAVVDATFLHRSQRQHFIALAERLQAPWLIVHSPVSPEVARARITKRACERRDPSEADVHVLEQQWQEQEPFDDSEAVLSVNGGTIEEVEALLAAHLPGILRTTR